MTVALPYAVHIERLKLKRRRILQMAGVIMTLAATGCATGTLLQGAVTDLENMIQDFINEVASLNLIPGITSTVEATIQGWVTQLQALLSTIGGIATTPTPAQLSAVQQALQIIENILNALADITSVLPSPWGSIVVAVDELLPVVAGIFGITVTSPSAPKSAFATGKLTLTYRRRFMAPAQGMSIIDAETIVAQYGKRSLIP